MKSSVIALSLLIAASAHAAAPTVEEVGDADSFGRDVVYLGNAQSNALYNARALITIEDEVLDDPTLIDPVTGLPYGGRMQLGLTSYSESRSIAPGERAQKSMFLSRHCIGGLVSRRSLVASGLSDTQAKQFFKKPMTITFGAQGSMRILDFANYFYGIRLYGDSKDK
jgi:hypothetical protein